MSFGLRVVASAWHLARCILPPYRHSLIYASVCPHVFFLFFFKNMYMVDKNTVGSLTRAAVLRLLEARSAIREPS